MRPVPDVIAVHPSETPRRVAIVIPCHNYGRYLAECLESVLAQTRPANEIVVVDDRSTDDTAEVAATFEEQGVRYLRTDFGNVFHARRIGYEETECEVLCFLDADDKLPPEYLDRGLESFVRPDVGIVYSDLQAFGDESRLRAFPECFDRSRLERENFIHAGSLVRREALRVSAAFEGEFPPQVAMATADWVVWKRVVSCGWTGEKQSVPYLYRQHASSASRRRVNGNAGYYQFARLSSETVTLFVPLSGRTSLWPRLPSFLDRQTWPHDQIHLILLDTSGEPAFTKNVRSWAADCDYTDVRVIQTDVGRCGLADEPRRAVANDVRLSMARIYNRMAREVSTPYVWILEDDIEPPLDACERLLRGFDPSTFSMSAAYRSRFHGGFVAWDHCGSSFRNPRSGVTTVGGNGFGCVILRSEALKNTIFTSSGPLPDYDRAFYTRQFSSGLEAKIDWSCECKHLSQSSATRIMGKGWDDELTGPGDRAMKIAAGPN